MDKGVGCGEDCSEGREVWSGRRGRKRVGAGVGLCSQSLNEDSLDVQGKLSSLSLLAMMFSQLDLLPDFHFTLLLGRLADI